MGYGSYSETTRSIRSTALGYETKSQEQIFTNRSISSAMNPYGVTLRESRDSEEHPNSVPIIIALDVTGSMGSIPHELVKKGLPNLVSRIIESGIPDPQILFLAIGDHECDSAPLQVGQFESSDELLDKWLTDVWLEGRGGGNDGESYSLAWDFAANYTEHDRLDKRGLKGFLFTIGDEPTLKSVPRHAFEAIMGPGQYGDMSSDQLLQNASKKYNCFHLHIKETMSGQRQRVIDGWKQLMQEDLIIVEDKNDVANIIADTIVGMVG